MSTKPTQQHGNQPNQQQQRNPHEILDQLTHNLNDLLHYSKFAQPDQANRDTPLTSVGSIEPLSLLTHTDVSATRLGTIALKSNIELEKLLQCIESFKMRQITNDHTNTLNTVQYQRELAAQQHHNNIQNIENTIEMLHTVIADCDEAMNSNVLKYMSCDWRVVCLIIWVILLINPTTIRYW